MKRFRFLIVIAAAPKVIESVKLLRFTRHRELGADIRLVSAQDPQVL